MMRWLASLLGRGPRQSPAGDPPGFDAVWQPGEIAECIADHGWFHEGMTPRTGPVLHQRCRVIDVYVDFIPAVGRRLPFLVFTQWPSHGYVAVYFRKVVPRADTAEAADRAFLEQLRTLPAPAKHPEPVDHG